MLLHEGQRFLIADKLVAEPRQPEVISVQKELLTGSQGIIDIDIDGTLITKTDGDITDPEIYSSIEQVQHDGFLVRLHSERPISSVKKYQAQFHTSPLLVGEGGNVQYLANPNLLVINNELALQYFDGLKKYLFGNLPHSFAAVPGGTPDFRYYPSDDPIEHISEWERKKDEINPLSSNLVFMQGSRFTGTGFWVFNSAEGEPKPNEELFARIGSVVEEYLTDSPPGFAIKTTTNQSRTFYSIGAANASKSSAWDTTFDLLGAGNLTGKRFFHIGDSAADSIGNPLVTNLAVANADSVLRQNAHRVSAAPYTGGVVEHLKWISANHRPR